MSLVLGRLDEAAAIAEYAVALDPMVPDYYTRLMWVYAAQYRVEATIESARTAIRLDPNIVGAQGILAWGLSVSGKTAEAMQACQLERWPPLRLTCAIHMHELAGDREKSDQAMQALQKAALPEAVFFLYANLFRGEFDLALHWLEQNADKMQVSQLAFVVNDPDLAPLRDRPRFQRVLQQLGLSKEQLAEISFTVKFDEDGRIIQ
jgi:tetratricopeptide (TPR) repeat protein